jgi:predicted Zn-dependent protease
MNYVTTSQLVVLYLVSICFFTSCQKNFDQPLKPSEFNKELREKLGDVTRVAIANDSENFNVLPNVPPYDTSVYWYVQNLYDQVTNPLRIDHQSNETNRWNYDRRWRVTILKEESLNAYAIPGGHFYITIGFLKALETEHELYYVLAFEASLMNEKLLLNRLISEHNTSILEDITKQIPVANGTDSQTLALSLKDLDFNEEDVLEVDIYTADLICKTSVFDRKGIIPILNRLENNPDFEWLQNRYYDGASRKDFVENVVNPDGNCGTLTSNGGYQRYILDILQ